MNIATQEWKVCDMEMEVVAFVIKWQIDRPSRSTVVNQDKKRNCCSLSCL